ncbi:DUF916 and DUF3324 domain-containing protein [Candidatus Enterococcus mangumiae]|uniref:DUF3324 domain-containing protein n=1 Tax=Candidatus Enterococcus mangumiae TaxID=2230878 RepID=A0ABZ2T0N5_9ENTE|nr:DUF916 and DUF3324 domain-containing protein [Enterococcus sp. DIV1094]
MRKISLVICFLFAFCFPLVAEAETETDAEVGFHIKAIIPDNQVDKKLTYFDLRLESGQKQTIKFLIENTSNEESTYKISVNQAYTNDQGFIDYTQPADNQEIPEEFQISKIAKVPESITLAGGKSQEVSIDLTMPEKEFDGQILSAIHVMKEGQAEQEGQIVNNYGYVLGLKLTNNENEVQRKLELEDIEPAISFGKTSVVATLKNPTMDAIGHLKYNAEVKNAAGETVKEVSYDKDMQMAPLSTYRFAIDWDNERLEAGDYSLHLTVADAKDNEWEFDREFTISENEAKEVNKVAITEVNQQSIPTWVYVVVGVLLGIIILLLIYFLFIRNKKKEE